ncbi:MAG TPA: phosphotransferase [Microthrixaceae bacterium]|nr:phosphotransferase [Microthrixaceae bacterium]
MGQPEAIVVDDPAELTSDWLTDALNSGGHELVVSSVDAERIGTGQMGATYRLHLTYEGDAGPSTLVAKLGAGDAATRTMVAPGYRAEVGFYTEIAPGLEVRTPRCWYGAIVPDGANFTLLLDDVRDALPGVQADGCSVAQARAAIANLVELHVPRWGDPALHDFEFLMQPDQAMADLMGQATVSATEEFVGRYAAQLGEECVATLREVAPHVAAWQVTRLDPFTVIHGDYRLDNLLFSPAEAIAVDWQTAAVGPPLRDVAYFLGTCVDPEQRRATEKDLVAEYHEAIVARGVSDYDLDRCWDDYRLGHLQAPMITTLGCIYATGERSDRSDAMFLAMARRSSEAIRDLRSLELL